MCLDPQTPEKGLKGSEHLGIWRILQGIRHQTPPIKMDILVGGWSFKDMKTFNQIEHFLCTPPIWQGSHVIAEKIVFGISQGELTTA